LFSGLDCQRRVVLPAVIPCLLFGLCVLVGCGTKNPFPRDSFDYGAFYNERGKHNEAVAALETFVRRNPTDSLAVRAQFLKAKSYMELKEYPVAAIELKILRQDYPTSPLVEDAYYLEGVAYLNEVGKIERDITGAYKARLHFLEFSRVYAASRYMPQVREHMQAVTDLLVEKKLRNANVFRQKGHHEAVAITLDTILETEPTSSLIDQVLMQRGQVAERTEDYETAREVYGRLLSAYPQSPLAREAQARLHELATAAGGAGES